MASATTLIDTRLHEDAVLCGYDGPADPSEGDGLIVTRNTYADGQSLSVSLSGPDGEVVLMGSAEIEQVILALQRAVLAHRGRMERMRAA